jgi:hypothetical protein
LSDSARAWRVSFFERARLNGIVELGTNVLTRACQRRDQLVGTAPELRGDQGKIANQHAGDELRGFVLRRSAQCVSQGGNTRDQHVNLFKRHVGRGFRAGRRQMHALKQ